MKKTTNPELNRLDVAAFKAASKTPITVILDSIRSLNNVGSVFRTCDAFLIEKIYLCGITATPPHRDIQKTALGSTDSVAWEHREDILRLIPELQSKGYRVYAIEQAQESMELQDFNPFAKAYDPIAIIMGNEVKGVSQEAVDLCDHCIEIPQFGTKHSLNISVTTGVVLWDLFGKWKYAKK